jgi:uncharacterized protein (TIGR00730 family)
LSAEPRRLEAVAVFCGSSPGADPRFREAAAATGALLGREGRTLVYGGGAVGLMGVVASAALEAGGRVIGVIPRALATRELLKADLSETVVVESMHERKALMAELSQAFVALPGGFGTFEELLEIVTWQHLGIHRKPVGVLDVAGYYSGLRRLVERSVEERFVRDVYAQALLFDEEPAPLLERLARCQLPEVPKWLDMEKS